MATPMDPLTQMNTYKAYVSSLGDASTKDEIKLRAIQDLSENLEVNFYQTLCYVI